MPKTKENQLYLTIKVDKQFKYELKGQAAKEMTTMQDLIIKVLKNYCRKKEYEVEGIFYEDLSEEEKKMLAIAEKEIVKGEYTDIDTFLEETKEDEN